MNFSHRDEKQKPLAPDIRVLIVDDEPRLREVLARSIQSWGFEVAAARSAEDALKMMREDPFDISIVDLNLPAMPGLDLFQQLRVHWPQHQVIILTGFGDLETARAAIRLDVVDFLQKPCPLDELEQSLYRAARRLPQPLPTVVSDVAAPAMTTPISGETSLEAVEREHILAILSRHQNNRTAAAAELGISRRTLHNKLVQYQREGYFQE